MTNFLPNSYSIVHNLVILSGQFISSRPRAASPIYLWGLLLLGLTACQSVSLLPQPPTPPLPPTALTNPLRVAVLTPTSGEQATFGRMLHNGIVMAFDEWNNRGGVMGQRLEWLDYDTGCDFASGEQATRQALAEGARFIIGPLCAEAAIGAAQSLEASQAVLIAPAAEHSLVTVTGEGQTRPTVFRAATAAQQQGQAAARFAWQQEQTRPAAILFNQTDDEAARLAEAFAQQFTALGGKIVYQGSDTPAEGDFSPTLQAITQAGTGVIYLPAPTERVNRLAEQLRQNHLADQILLLGSDGWDSAGLDLAAASGGYFTPAFFLKDNRPETRQWADTYKATYAIEPTILAALGYESASLLAQAIEQAGSSEVGAVSQALSSGQFEGITGPLSFDPQHNPRKPIPVVQLTGEGLRFITYQFNEQ
jgi:branched-chain amino acid transport system substrate-binding protein